MRDPVSFLMGMKFASNDDRKIFGVYWDKSSNPTLTRIGDAVGMIANAGVDGKYVRNDFDNAAIYREIGEVTDELGNVFIKIPKFYIRKRDGATFKSWEISKTKYPGFYLPWCFWDFSKNRELPYILVGKYKATLSADDKLESKPDKYPLVNKNIVQFREYAKANGKGYQQLDIHVVDVLQTLFYVEFATLNSQSVMYGFATGRYTDTEKSVVAEDHTNRIIVPNVVANQYRVGQPIGVGTTQGGNQIFYGRDITEIDIYDDDKKSIWFDGPPVNIPLDANLYNVGWKNGFSKNIFASSGSIVSNSDGKYPCVYRGIESPWGDVYQFVDGININDLQAWVTKNAEDYASNVFAAPYEPLNYLNVNENGYVSEMGFDTNFPFAEFPTKTGGSSSTYYADYYYQNSGQRVALVGGAWDRGANAGRSCWRLYFSSSYSYVSFGGRLLKKPL